MSRIVSTSLWSNEFNDVGVQMDRGSDGSRRDIETGLLIRKGW